MPNSKSARRRERKSPDCCAFSLKKILLRAFSPHNRTSTNTYKDIPSGPSFVHLVHEFENFFSTTRVRIHWSLERNGRKNSKVGGKFWFFSGLLRKCWKVKENLLKKKLKWVKITFYCDFQRCEFFFNSAWRKLFDFIQKRFAISQWDFSFSFYATAAATFHTLASNNTKKWNFFLYSSPWIFFLLFLLACWCCWKENLYLPKKICKERQRKWKKSYIW